MNEDILNMNIRKFLKTVGITSQREIEAAIRNGIKTGNIEGKSTLPISVKLQLPELGLDHLIEGKINLE